MADTRTLTIRFKAEGGEKLSETLRTVKRDGDKVFTQVLKDGKLVSTTIRTIDLDLRKLGQTMIGVGQNMTRYLTLPIIAAGAGLLKLGMDAEETRNLVKQSFKEMTGAAEAWAKTSTAGMVNTKLEAERQAAMFFLMTKNMGIARDAAFQMGTSLADLTADMSSFYNLKPDEMFQRIQSGIAGEIEPLRRLGIALDENTVKTYALKEGIMKKGQELTQVQKVMIRYNLIMGQTSDSQGDLKRTADSATNQLRIQKAEFLESATALGESLIPVMNTLLKDVLKPLVDEFGDLAKAYEGLDPQAQRIVLWSAAALAALGPVVTVVGNLLKAIKFLGAGGSLGIAAAASSFGTGYLIGETINYNRGGMEGMLGAGAFARDNRTAPADSMAFAKAMGLPVPLSVLLGGDETSTKGGGLLSTEDIKNAGGGGGGKKGRTGGGRTPKTYMELLSMVLGSMRVPGANFQMTSLNDAQTPIWEALTTLLSNAGEIKPAGFSFTGGIPGLSTPSIDSRLSFGALGGGWKDWGKFGHWSPTRGIPGLPEPDVSDTDIFNVMGNMSKLKPTRGQLLSKAFGQQGIASIAGGFMSGGVGGGISSALGVAGSALGPWGALAGGLLGNLVGGLFGKKKRQNRDGQTQATALIVQSQQLEDLKVIMLRVAPQLRQVGAGTNMALAAIRNQGGR